jgi:predicted oxidoreductase
MSAKPDRIELGPGFEISRIVTGLWQIADMEKTGVPLDPDALAAHLADYAEAGFDSFDMADHYGSAEDVAGLFNASSSSRPRLLTKWCPKPGAVSA